MGRVERSWCLGNEGLEETGIEEKSEGKKEEEERVVFEANVHAGLINSCFG